MTFEWDEAKERYNIWKHGIRFITATSVFSDPFRLEIYDEMHSDDEVRYITIGEIKSECMILFVVYTERAESIRIISARRASSKERRLYYDRT